MTATDVVPALRQSEALDGPTSSARSRFPRTLRIPTRPLPTGAVTAPEEWAATAAAPTVRIRTRRAVSDRRAGLQESPERATDRAEWTDRLERDVFATDALIVTGSVLLTQLARLGSLPSQPTIGWGAGQLALSVLLVLAWTVALEAGGSRHRLAMGTGTSEYKKVLGASTVLFGLLAILLEVVEIELFRGYWTIAFPLGTAALLAGRWLRRRYLVLQRRRGRLTSRVLVVGSRTAARETASRLSAAPDAGYRVVGLCVPGGSDRDGVDDAAAVPVVGNLTGVHESARRVGADTIVVTTSESFGAEALRRLSWELEGSGIDLVVVPAVTDVAESRLVVRPVAGLPLLHVLESALTRDRQRVKNLLDRVGAVALVALLSPVFAAVAVAIKLSSPGPVLYRQTRVGRSGRSFQVWKFRSMRPDADADLQALLAQQGTSDKPLFKVVNDPRVTPVGHFLRKYSLDELPQLFNVVTGEMSLVGPRPQRAEEVALYDEKAHRRLLAKPGMTGLWQVSGRSNLAWDDAIRLDLHYVENWSHVFDLSLLLRTASAVVAGRGAY